MDKELIKKLILFAQDKDTNLVEREFDIKFVGKINCIIGPRRAGKTFFIYQTIKQLKSKNLKDKILYINLEDERLWPVKKEDLDLILESYYELYPENKNNKIFIFLDEIQLAPVWQKFIRRIYDQENVEITITGSSSKLLGREIATELRGRGLTYFVPPYSFREFLRAKGVLIERHFEYKPIVYKVKKLLQEYITYGGFPEIVDKEETIKIKILQEYFDLVFYKDILERQKIRNFTVLREMMQYLLNNFSSYFSVNRYFNILKSQGQKTGKSTLFGYISYITDTNFMFLVSKYGSFKEQMTNPKKVYAVDTGLVNALSSRSSMDLGKFYENIVFLHLKLQEKEVYYWKDRHECDFLIKERTKVTNAIQVCYDLNKENREREINGLLDAMDNFNLRNGLIITHDYNSKERFKNRTIEFIPLWKWLLEDKKLGR